MKKNLSNLILVLIFFIGLSVLLYPTVSDYVNSKSQSKAISSFVESLSYIDEETNRALIEEAEAYNRSLLGDPARFSVSEQELAQYHKLLGSTGGAIGYLEIGAIRVSLPLYLGTEETILQVGAGTMQGSSLPIVGESTHAAITGHRGLPSSRLLTDLDQMAVGDTFVVYVLNEILTYEVDQIRIVEPEDMSNLAIEEGRDLCTLVTCTPYGVNSHRLLVRGHRVENAAGVSAVSARVTADAIQVDTLLVAPIVAIPILLSLLAVFLLRDKMIPAVQTDSIGEQETDETDENP